MEVSENSSVQTPSSSELALNQPMLSDNGDIDREISDENRAEAKLGFPEPRASSDSDSDSMAFDLVLREEFASLVLRESEGSLKSDCEAKREEGVGNDGVKESDRELMEKDRDEAPEESIEDNDEESEEKKKNEGNEEALKIEGVIAKNGSDESEENRDERSGPENFQIPVGPEAEGLGNQSESNEEALKIEGESAEEDQEVKIGGHESEKRAERSGPKRFPYPLRPEAEDCAYYLRTWSCKFGLHCKLNHPARRKPGQQPAKERARQKEKEDTSEKPYRLSEHSMQSDPLRQSEPSRQQECKYYLRSGGCKYGKSCKNLHDPGAKVVPALVPAFDYNFLGLPLRVGEKECMFYMRTGSCKYGVHCRFNHPNPTDETGSKNPKGYNNVPVPLQGGSQSTMGLSWSSSRSMNETLPASFVPLMAPPSQGPPSQNSYWNGYQAPLYLPPERNMPPPSSAYTMNNHQSSQNQAEDYPERPGQPDCSFFMKTGDCKFRYNCKYNHPKNRGLIFTPCTLSDKGLPLRPDQNICAHYSRYGICKYGPACKYDHSPLANLTVSGGENQPMYGGLSTAMEGAGMARSGSRSEIAIQL